MRRKLLVLPVMLAGLVGLSHGQQPGPPGGFGGGRGGFGGGTPDPEVIWGFVSRGQPSINLNDPTHARTKERMQRDGTPIPADGILTKEAFKANFQARMQQRGTGGPPGAPPVMPGSPPVQVQFGGPPPGSDRGGGRSGYDPSGMTDDQLRQFMRRYDADGDGRISLVEAAQSDSMRDGFSQYDANRDGYWDVTEYRAYNTARYQRRMQEIQSAGGGGAPAPQFTPPPAPGGPVPPPAAPGQPPAAEETRPEVLRYGKLPKGAPSWMLAPTKDNGAGLDADRDGQIGLYEWRRAGKRTSEFVDQDLNADGYLTYTEWKTYQERLVERQKAEDPDAAAPTVITPGGPAAGGERGRGDRPDRGGKGEKGERKGSRNPFSNSSKGG